MTGRRVVIGVLGVLLALGLGGAGFWACGGDDGDRDDKVCRTCTIGVDRGCFDECRGLCVANDPDCAPRCTAQCDECRRDLACGDCVGDCSGSRARCAPTDAAVACEDGTFGGRLPVPPS